jgi:hypothetical protein
MTNIRERLASLYEDQGHHEESREVNQKWWADVWGIYPIDSNPLLVQAD